MDYSRDRDGQAGSVLMVALLVSVLLGGLAVSVLTTVTSSNQELRGAQSRLQRQYLAEAGLAAAVEVLNNGGDGSIGSRANPVPMTGGSFFCTALDNPDNTVTLTCRGTNATGTSAIEAVVRPAGGAFANAIYAGNSSGDPNYTLEFGGRGTVADDINGDIYSGGNVDVWGDASIAGTVRAAGAVTGMGGETGSKQPPLDIGAMDYTSGGADIDIDVAAEFNAAQQYRSDDAGGNAWQLPEDMASHIFRKNPDDRRTEINGTAKDDFFLEDPYERVGVDRNWDGTDAYEITLSGTGGEPGPDSNNKVFYIDGNLWIHNRPTYSFKFVHPNGEPLKATFVVRGNIYVSDNVFYGDMDTDALALLAIEDPNVADSGNIYFGDPRGGTLETMHSFMYAENNFYDNNLDNSGSDKVILYGTMSAGNHVAIKRSFQNQYSQFILDFDQRLLNGDIELPGLPSAAGGQLDYQVIMWRRLSDALAQ